MPEKELRRVKPRSISTLGNTERNKKHHLFFAYDHTAIKVAVVFVSALFKRRFIKKRRCV